MVIHNPPHPGEVIRELCIEPLGLTVTEAAKGLGVSSAMSRKFFRANRQFKLP
jgi:plasmid maintenance system antidote protein VapI